MSAIRNAIENKVQGTISSGLRKVAGGILRGNRTNTQIPPSARNDLNQGRFNVKHLSYPLNVDTDNRQGHYIMFNINELKKSKITIDEALAGKKDNTKGITGNDVEGYNGAVYGQPKSNEMKNGMSKNTNSVYKEMYQSSKRLDTTISLYMPPTVQVQYGANYGEEQIGLMAETGLNAFKAFMRTSGSIGDKIANVGGAISAGAGEMLPRAALKAADAFAPGIKALAQIEMGKIMGSQMELMFEGVGRRSFSFTFVFIPKSERESQVVDQIIKKFKYHMLPSFVGDSRRSMTIPDMFDITYMHKGDENAFLNKISTCFLESADVTYGGDRFNSYGEAQTLDGTKGAPPQRTTLTLSFKEIEIMTREKILEGF
tara:strand:+ start:94 stop:1209 length:1116 start_codon:yes stop_codon:yes gene_type:complete